MPTATYSAQQKDKGQSSQRRSQIWRDEHGRKWHSTVDLRDRSQAPASPLSPSGWRAPVVPPDQYVSMHPDATLYGALVIDYAAWVRDLNESRNERARALEVLALTMAQGDDQLKARLIDHPTAAMLHTLGPSALKREYVLACMKGDPWALGLSDVQPAWAQKLWPEGQVRPANVPDYDYSFLEDDAEAKTALKGRKQAVG